MADLTDRYLQPVMYERDTGRYKFTAVCYSQSKDGIPVFGSRLIFLVRNEGGYPLVLVSSDLRNLGGFKPQMRPDRRQSQRWDRQCPESVAKPGQLHPAGNGDLGGRG